jgi:cardiolipin synthase
VVHRCAARHYCSKTALTDGVWTTAGSTDLDWRSFLYNRALNAMMLGPDFGFQVQAMFVEDLAQSDVVMLQPWNRRPLRLRATETFAKAWEYWL